LTNVSHFYVYLSALSFFGFISDLRVHSMDLIQEQISCYG